MLYEDRDDDADEKMKSPKVGEKESRRWSRHLSSCEKQLRKLDPKTGADYHCLGMRRE